MTEQGESPSCPRVRRLMKQQKVEVKTKREFKATTDSKHGLPVAPNRLERQFQVDASNKAYVGDIAYIRTDEGGRPHRPVFQGCSRLADVGTHQCPVGQ